VNNEIVIGREFTSILQTDTDMDSVRENYEYEENNDVIHKPVIRNRSIRTSDFLNTLNSEIIPTNEILPNGCRYCQNINNEYKAIVVEEPPRIRTIKVDMGIEAVVEKLKKTGKLEEFGYENYLNENPGGATKQFQLSFPYVVFIILLNQRNEMVTMKPFFRLHPITSLADYVCKAPLYNIPSGQDICLGGVNSFDTVSETVENIIETFWLNIYNYDYTENIKAYEKSEAFEVQDYLTWMYYTKVNPMFIYNVKWINYDHNIGRIINDFKRSFGGGRNNRNSDSSYERLRHIVSDSSSSQSPEAITHPNIKNASFSVVINEDVVSVGDKLLFEEKPYYLYSIITHDNGYTYASVELEDKEGNIINVPFDDFEDDYKSLYQPQFIEETEIQGKTIKPGTIISCKIGTYTVYKKIKKIREALDGKIECLIGNDHYLIENIDFDTIDISNVKIEGKPLETDKNYYMIENSDSYSPTFVMKILKFDSVSVTNSGSFVIKFKYNNGDRNIGYNVDLNDYEDSNNSKQFIEENELEEHPVIVQFDKLLVNFNSRRPLKSIKNKGTVVSPNCRFNDYLPGRDDKKRLVENILIEDGKRLFIPGMVNQDFKVGDPIVYANWETPEDMLIISSIDKFEFNEEENKIYVHSTSLNKKHTYKIPYVNLATFRVNIGVIRKVVSQVGEWRSGDKIKALTTGITNFPKKDTNSIVAFIDDGSTKYPIALCSNLCSLWMNEATIEKFLRFPIKTKEWKKFENAPFDVNKIKWQHGDNIVTNQRHSNNQIMFLGRRQGTQYGFEYHYCQDRGGMEWGTNITKPNLDQYYARHGFIMPRIAVSNRFGANNRRGFPNFLGGYIRSNNSRVYLRSEQFKEEF
jgi:hypothetical protein